MSDTDRLAELLIEVFPAANRNQWPFAATDVAAALIAAGVRVAPSPDVPAEHCPGCTGAMPVVYHDDQGEPCPGVAPSPDAPDPLLREYRRGFDAGIEFQRAAPSPDAPGLREALERIAKGHDWQPGKPTHGWASCQRIADAALAASGDAPREGLREAAMAAVHADAALVKATNEGDDDDVDEASAQYAEAMDRLAAALAATPDAPDCVSYMVEDGS